MKNLATQVEDIAHAAGRAIMEVYGQQDVGLEHKADASPLTLADQRSHELICARLTALDEHYPVYSEEGFIPAYPQRMDVERYWLVDPLDGTKEFVNRNGEFSVCIALIQQNAAVLGVVHEPVTGKSFVAWKGGGVHTKAAADVALKPLAKRNPIDLNSAGLRFGVSRSHLNDAAQQYVGAFVEPRLIKKGSALKFCALAEGSIDIYPRFSPTMEWDTAAGQIIVEEAGGTVWTNSHAYPLTYNRESLVNPSFIAKAAIVN